MTDIQEWIEDSYDLVVDNLPKALKLRLQGQVKGLGVSFLIRTCVFVAGGVSEKTGALVWQRGRLFTPEMLCLTKVRALLRRGPTRTSSSGWSGFGVATYSSIKERGFLPSWQAASASDHLQSPLK